MFDDAGFVDVPVARMVSEFESGISPGRHDGQQLTDVILEKYSASGREAKVNV